MSNIKQVIVMRKDLNMRKGKMVAQGAHASLGAFNTSLKNKNHLEINQWIDNGQSKICVSVDSERELIEIHTNALKIGLVSCMITDAGKTEFNGKPTRTCLCIGPNKSEDIDKITGHLKLL